VYLNIDGKGNNVVSVNIIAFLYISPTEICSKQNSIGSFVFLCVLRTHINASLNEMNFLSQGLFPSYLCDE
jgi:hypothetical protein